MNFLFICGNKLNLRLYHHLPMRFFFLFVSAMYLWTQHLGLPWPSFRTDFSGPTAHLNLVCSMLVGWFACDSPSLFWTLSTEILPAFHLWEPWLHFCRLNLTRLPHIFFVCSGLTNVSSAETALNTRITLYVTDLWVLVL